MTIDVKICGLKDADSVREAVDGGAAYVGFVFYPPSPRAISVEEAAVLAAPARGKAKIVALTVDADDDLLNRIVEGLRPDILQFHGSETPQRVRAVRETYDIPVMKAVKIGGEEDILAARAFDGYADMVLFDARPKPGEGLGLPGGNGVSFDWKLMAGLDLDIPLMLSGGLDSSNVPAAISQSGARAVDVSSGVESAPGVKDPARVREFLAAVRNAEGVPA
ncbi:phosphoribosylanthranilate isomerase [Tepidamorphus sp. 3E244]|uniref:phosphoribosylanthranilate isomerase n=1 Tax=Tepidamorphus sp. 3E244 TaxID=3385498 RepID=UPI0038FD22E6